MPRVFISYSHADQAWAAKLANSLQRLDQAGKLTGAAKSTGLFVVAQEYAVDGQLYAARKIADQCLPNDQLAAYAAILEAHAIQARPQLRNVIGGVFDKRN